MNYFDIELEALEINEGTDLEKTLEDIRRISENKRCALQLEFWNFRENLQEECNTKIKKMDVLLRPQMLKHANQRLHEECRSVSAELQAINYHQERLEEAAKLYYDQ